VVVPSIPNTVPPKAEAVTAPIAVSTIAPAVSPSPNRAGGFSLSRQLGLGIGRIAIDPGHGGHDPGARVKGLTEADLVLDLALRLEKLLQKRGVEVLVTRRSHVFVPLEERIAIANRARADLFLSIHANASTNPSVRGLETYFLNFAPNPEAEAIAARENAGSARTMHNLPDIVKAIATNNKIDESRDLASTVHQAMYTRLRKVNRGVRSLGVKQAPFMVLLGATMPSALIEVAFITNQQEAGLLRAQSYRQQLAEALFDGITLYKQSLKTTSQTVASQ
jgi:N-acetylmuramoyl-L-alanine amidase